MKFVINQQQLPFDMLKGIAATYPHLQHLPQTGVLYDKTFTGQSVPILSGGGSGHEPAHMGYVGHGMLVASVSGALFVPPKATDIKTAIQQVNFGKGVLCVIKNFEADLKEFQEAIYNARSEGIDVRYVITQDDISVEAFNFQQRHRGVAGTVLVHKILGAAAKHGASLDELEQLGLELTTNIHTLGVALDSIRYAYGNNSFDLKENEICFGIGIHGEPGYRVEKFQSYERIAIELLNKLQRFAHLNKQESYIALINGLGSTTMMELFTFQHHFLRLMALKEWQVSFSKVGNFMTSCDMSGISLTLCPVKDSLWIDYLEEETNAFAWK